MKILIAVIIFSVIIISKLGHFLLAKKNGIVVTEFSLGMGPRLFSTQKGETRYSIKLFPIGGSCAMLGEDTERMNFREPLMRLLCGAESLLYRQGLFLTLFWLLSFL